LTLWRRRRCVNPLPNGYQRQRLTTLTQPNFNITTLCPPFIYGPLINHVSSLSSLNTSSNDVYRLFNGSEKEVPPTAFYSFVDVRDRKSIPSPHNTLTLTVPVADAHVLAYESSSAANQRFLTASSAYTYQQICDIIRAEFPELRESTPEGEPGAPIPPVYSVDTSKATRELGAKFRPLMETIVDMVKSLRALEVKA
jgi:nucleoside-diphosphate-sugar epimerase